MAKFFRFRWAESGDKTAIPETTQPSGVVSYEEGFGYDYERPNDGSDPLAKDVPRNETNQYLYDITDALHQYQTHGIPDFITNSDNGGSPYPYDKHVRVLYDDGVSTDPYTSLVDSNTALPTDATKWRKGDGGITELTGDVTAAGVGSVVATITAGAVTTVKIAAKAVTFAKMQDINAYSVLLNSTGSSGQIGQVALANKQILGRGDPTTGTMGALAVGTGLDILGNTLINTLPAVDSRQLAKAWGSTGGGAGYNIASVTFNPSGGNTNNGSATFTFTNPMPNANYAYAAGYSSTSSSNGNCTLVMTSKTVNSITLEGRSSGSGVSGISLSEVSLVIFST